MHFIRNKTMEICDYRRYKACAMKFDESTPFDEYEKLYEKNEICKCFPSCNSVNYKSEIHEKFKSSEKDNNLTKFTFRFKDGEYFALLRYQPFKLVDFLAYIGGILGLFAGISVLSIVEVFYFFTLRIFSDVLRHLRE